MPRSRVAHTLHLWGVHVFAMVVFRFTTALLIYVQAANRTRTKRTYFF